MSQEKKGCEWYMIALDSATAASIPLPSADKLFSICCNT